jgi:hypothetical protein
VWFFNDSSIELNRPTEREAEGHASPGPGGVTETQEALSEGDAV